ncbi:VanW family protein, partial [Candidatus Woesebacteria bacterium]|nr:VanW family protein [Candidatus Woesebacteria bacterium]
MFNKKLIKKLKTKLKKIRQNRNFRISLKISGLLFFFLILYLILSLGRISPGIYVAEISLAGKTPEEAVQIFSQTIKAPSQIILVDENETFEIDLEKTGFSYDFIETARAAYELDKTGNIFYDLYKRAVLPIKNVNLGLRLSFDEEKLSEILSVIAGQVSIEPVYPSVKLVGKNAVVEKGQEGQELDTEKLRIEIGQSLAFAKNDPIALSIKAVDPTLTDEEGESLQGRAENLINKRLFLNFEYETYSLRENDLFKFFDPKNEYLEESLSVYISDLALKINREPQNPNFIFEAGRVREFAPAKDGIKVKEELLKEMIVGNLRTLETSEEKILNIDIPFETTAPEIKTGDVNNMGIKELIGRGSSRFRGSISSRIYNLTLAASRFNGILIEPGEVFSFNQVLGEVSAETGYKQAYIIKDGRTELDDGGGVCQVSTTFFRAVLDTGLPVIERRAHAYRVGYYEQDSPVGFDATVYEPTTDFKFKNNTPGHLLIQTYSNTSTASLVFEIYGTSDG